jgi:hypothetical protein
MGMIDLRPRAPRSTTLINRPLRPCPKCGDVAFGTLGVSPNVITRRCRSCRHTSSEPLPQLQKKIVYLDQMILSNMAKVLDPVWREERRPRDPFWVAAFDALDRAVKLQLIVCPYSPVHEDESRVARHFPMLQRMYQHLAIGVELDFPILVHELQLCHAFTARLKGNEVDYRAIGRDQVLHGDVDGWADRFNITVEWSAGRPDADVLRRGRDSSGDAWAQLFRKWGVENQSFDLSYAIERRAFAQAVGVLYLEHVAALRDASLRGEITESLWNYRLEVDIVKTLRDRAEIAGHRSEDGLRMALEFLRTPIAMDAPANDIAALLMAAIARRAASGQRRPPSRGMWSDIMAISSYLPYCDVMFVDDECATLLGEGPLKERINYPTKIFSNRTRENFLSYLAGLESEAGPGHRDRVVAVYGESWLTPYRDLLRHERERRRRG